jgi:hypothetical protein
MDIFTIVYIIGLIIAMISVVGLRKKTHTIYNILAIFLLIFMFVTGAMRSVEIGYDNIGHIAIFEAVNFGGISALDFGDIGFSFLSLIVGLIGGYEFFLVVVTIIMLSILLFVTSKFSNNWYMTMYFYYSIYFFGYNMSKLRMGLAILIGTLALYQLFKKNNMRFVIMAFTASLFHFSALILYVVYLFRNLRLTRLRMWIIFLVTLLIGVSQIIPMIISQVFELPFWNYIEAFGIQRVYTYLDREDFIDTSGYLGLILNIFNFLVLILTHKIVNFTKIREINYLYKFYFFGLISSVLLYSVPLGNQRFSGYLLVLQIFLYPHLYKLYSNRNYRILFVFVHIFSIMLLGYVFYLRNIDDFAPFKFFWE